MSTPQHNFREQPLYAQLAAARPVFWVNPLLEPTALAMPGAGFTREEVDGAAARLKRFAPCMAKVFPETAPSGLIESPLHAAHHLARAMVKKSPLHGGIFIKLDNQLPVSGSIEARGGVHEVLKFAEDLALEADLLKLGDDYSILAEPTFSEFFGRHSLAVGSSGNLDLAVGIMGARLGFNVTVHMSADARPWKKDLLLAKGAKVVEHAGDYDAAVAVPGCRFVDVENSRELFLGYTAAAARLKLQLEAQGVVATLKRPLSVYLPCGAGGGAAGVAFGLKALYGDAVRCWFAEPVQAPNFLLGLFSHAPALACQAMSRLLDGAFTLEEDDLYRLLALTADTENLKLATSALAGFPGPALVTAHEKANRLTPSAAHVLWATGGGLTPPDEWQTCYEKGKNLG